MGLWWHRRASFPQLSPLGRETPGRRWAVPHGLLRFALASRVEVCGAMATRIAGQERADPAASANARERDVIRMGLLRSASPVAQKGSLSARPRAAHL